MNDIERFSYRYAAGEVKGVKGNPREAQRLLDENKSMTEAEKIVKDLKWYGNIGHVSPQEMINFTLEELGEVGVELSEKQLEKLLSKIMEFHNNSHLMCNKGWKPVDLMAHAGMPSAISFGPGIKAAMEDGSIDKEELIKTIQSMGLDILDD